MGELVSNIFLLKKFLTNEKHCVIAFLVKVKTFSQSAPGAIDSEVTEIQPMRTHDCRDDVVTSSYCLGCGLRWTTFLLKHGRWLNTCFKSMFGCVFLTVLVYGSRRCSVKLLW
jgi:hypothetical protein